MKRNIIFIIAMFLICFVYIKAMNFWDTHKSSGSKPSIQVDSSILEVSVKDPTSVLLEGVKALDKEDGDISDSVIVESISSLDENLHRTINYAVFDSDGNVSRMVRTMRYSDYAKPTISIKKGLVMYSIPDIGLLTDYVEAYSSVDGDITSSIRVESLNYDGFKGSVLYSVSDSCGGYEQLELDVTLVNKVISNEISLSAYQVSIPAGIPYFNPRSYISSISGPLGNLDPYINQVVINDNVDYDTPGTYDILYTINTDDGSFGATKLLVNVY